MNESEHTPINEVGWLQIDVVRVREQIKKGDFQHALNLARRRYQGIQDYIQDLDDVDIQPEELDGLMTDAEIMLTMMAPLKQLEDIAQELSDNIEMPTDRTHKLIEKAREIKETLKQEVEQIYEDAAEKPND